MLSASNWKKMHSDVGAHQEERASSAAVLRGEIGKMRFYCDLYNCIVCGKMKRSFIPRCRLGGELCIRALTFPQISHQCI